MNSGCFYLLHGDSRNCSQGGSVSSCGRALRLGTIFPYCPTLGPQLPYIEICFTALAPFKSSGSLSQGFVVALLMLRISLLTQHLRHSHDSYVASTGDAAASVASAGTATSAGKKFSEVAEALTKYFDGAHNVEPELTRSIWHPEVAQLKGVGDDGQIIVVEPRKYLENIAAGAAGSTDSIVLAADKIVSIEFTSPRTVLARVEVADPLDADGHATVYTDFISMVDITGCGWTVVSKVFAGR